MGLYDQSPKIICLQANKLIVEIFLLYWRLTTFSAMVCLWYKWQLKHCSSLKIVQLPIIWHWLSVHILQLLNAFLARRLEILAYDIKIWNWTWVWKHFFRSSVCSTLRSSILVLGCKRTLNLRHHWVSSAPWLWHHHFFLKPQTREPLASCGYVHLWVCSPSLGINYHTL